MGLLRQPTSDITKGVIWKQLLAFFFPLWFGTFFQQLYNTVDTLVVGRFVGKVALAPYELLVKIVIPYDNYVGYTGHYIKYAQRNAMDIATLGVSCLVKLTSDKKMVDDAALAFGVAGPVPMRSPAAEAAVRGLPIGEAIAAIGEAALADVNPRTSWRASKEFRIQLVKELSARALREAAETDPRFRDEIPSTKGML